MADTRRQPAGQPSNTGVSVGRVSVVAMACITICLAAAPAAAADQPSPPGSAAVPANARNANTENPNDQSSAVTINVTAAQAARAARLEYGGRILAVILVTDAESPYYRIKLLGNGQLRVVRVTAHK